MYQVSQRYKDKIQDLDRAFEIHIRVEHSKGTLNLKDKDVAQGSFEYMDGSQAGDEFTVGGTVASNISFDLVNRTKYDDINFIGAKVIPTIRFILEEGIDSHFIQPSQPSKMVGFDEEYEDIPLGQFNIDIADRKRNIIKLKAIDNMINLDKPYSLSKLSYPANLYQIYTNICNVADVQIGTTNFTNQDYIVQERPMGDLTLRNVLGFVAELSGSFAKFNRLGGLELRWYKDTGVTITSHHRSSLEFGDIEINITGVSVESDEVMVGSNGEEENIVYLTGTDEYSIDLTGNELLQGNYENVLPNILARVENISFTPYTANWHGNPAMESGDKITHIDIDGNVHESIITHLTYKYRGTSKIDAKGLPNISRGFQSTDNRVASIIKRVEKDVGDKLTTLEQEQLNATELIGNMLGGHLTEIKHETDINYDRFGKGIFIHDQKLLRNSNKLWKWGIGGFGYSDDGGLTYKTGVTASGSIVAELVSANIITADMIQTGLLQSEDGSSWFNLETGEINIKNQLQFIDGQLRLQSPDIPEPQEPQEPVDLTGIRQDIVDIKNLKPNTVGSGRTTIDSNGIKVTHTGSGGQYSEMRSDGFVRKWQHGEAKYLNDIFVEERKFDITRRFDSPPPATRVYLPTSFRNRGNSTKVILVPTKFEVFISSISGGNSQAGALIYSIVKTLDIQVEVAYSNFTATSPYIDVTSHMGQDFVFYDGVGRLDYYRVNFLIMVVGE